MSEEVRRGREGRIALRVMKRKSEQGGIVRGIVRGVNHVVQPMQVEYGLLPRYLYAFPTS